VVCVHIPPRHFVATENAKMGDLLSGSAARRSRFVLHLTPGHAAHILPRPGSYELLPLRVTPLPACLPAGRPAYLCGGLPQRLGSHGAHTLPWVRLRLRG
jgi:hypothetical protein